MAKKYVTKKVLTKMLKMMKKHIAQRAGIWYQAKVSDMNTLVDSL